MIGATETRPATKKELQEEMLTVAQSSTLHRFSNANAKSTSAEQTAPLTIVPVRMEANAQSAMPMIVKRLRLVYAKIRFKANFAKSASQTKSLLTTGRGLPGTRLAAMDSPGNSVLDTDTARTARRKEIRNAASEEVSKTSGANTSTTEIQLLKHKRAALVRFGVSGIRGTGLVDRLALDC